MKLARIYQRLQRIADILEEDEQPVQPVSEQTEPVNVQTDEEFVAWLRETLIPDLRESGMTSTAQDFEEGIMLAEGGASPSVVQDYVNYLNGTLIPNLQENRQVETASDFQKLVRIILKDGLAEKDLAEPVEEPVEPEPEPEPEETE